jgi:hypothetical protein
MKILLVSSAFFPENSPRSFRATELAKELCRQGHSVVLATLVTPERTAFAQQHGLELLDLGERKLRFISRPKNRYLDLAVRAINRLMSLAIEYPDIELMFKTKRLLRNQSEYDLLITIAVPHPIHWGAALVRRQRGQIAKIWVADCGDPYTLVTTDSFRKPFYFGFIEKLWGRRCDYLAIPKLEMKVNFFPEFESKIVEIPQGFNLEESRVHLGQYRPHAVPTFAFSGNFIPGNRDPRPLLEYLVNTDIDFRFHIFTKIRHMVEPYMEKANGRIILSDYIPREQLLHFLSEMDFLVNITYDPAHQVPSKLIDYLLTERPILNLDYTFDPKKTAQFLAGDYSQRFNSLSVDRYDIQTVARQFTQLAATPA